MLGFAARPTEVAAAHASPLGTLWYPILTNAPPLSNNFDQAALDTLEVTERTFLGGTMQNPSLLFHASATAGCCHVPATQ